MATARMEPTPLVSENGVADKDAKWRALQHNVEDHSTAVANAEMWADPDAPDGMDAEEEGPPDADVLGPCDVRLSDGRIATLRSLTFYQQYKVDGFLSRHGFRMENSSPMSYYGVQALMCLEGTRKAGDPPDKMRVQKVPRDKGELEYLMNQFKGPDATQLALGFIRINLGQIAENGGDQGEPAFPA